MSAEVSPASRGFPEAPLVATTDPEVQRLRASVEARLTGGEVEPVRIGRFVVLERVGQGAMGVVYAAYDSELDRKVALKVLHATRDDPGMRMRLMREAQAMARLSHPNVVTVYEAGESQGVGFVAMEFVRGRTLRQWQAEGRPTPAEVLAAFQQAGRGLAAAHEAGVVHRDFKPDNVLVEGEAADLRVRVADFGLASTHAADPASSERDGSGASGDSLTTRPGARMGTPGYMAPEQILAEPTDARSDQFAFCVSLWEALAGARPFGGGTTPEVFAAVLGGVIEPPPPTAMPAFVEVALRTGLASRPEARHPSMSALLLALATDPRRRRRRRVAIGLAIAVVPAAIVSLQVRAAMARRACEQRAAVIDGVWHTDAAASVTTAIAATGSANATATAARASEGLGAYAESWRAAATAACVAIEVDHVLDLEAAERATACLEERRQGLATLVDALAQADVAVVDNAVRSVLQLPAVDRCNDVRALALDLRPPDDPEARAALRGIQAKASATEGLRRLGRNREALAELEALEAPAAALQWPAISARIGFRMAQLQINLAAFERARELGEGAFLDAFRAGDDETTAMSAALLSHVLGVLLARPEEAGHWDALATAATERLPVEQRPPVELFLGTIQGRRLLLAGDTEGAEAALDRALTAGETLWGRDHVLLSDALLVLANSQCRRSAWSECRATHERAYAILSAALGEDHPWTARAQAGLGLSLGHDGDPQRALALLDAALEVDERHFGPDHINVGVDHSYAGLVLLEAGEPARAIGRFERALSIMQASFPPDHPEVTTAIVNLGRAQREAGRLAEARATLERAQAIHRANPTADRDTIAETEAELAKVLAAEGRP